MAFLFSGRFKIHQVIPSSFSTFTVLNSFTSDISSPPFPFLNRFPWPSSPLSLPFLYQVSLSLVKPFDKSARIDLAKQAIIDKGLGIRPPGLRVIFFY